MREIIEHPIYELLKTKYGGCQLDIVIIENNENYEEEKSHKKALLFAFNILNNRLKESDWYKNIYLKNKENAKFKKLMETYNLISEYTIDESKMKYQEINIQEFLKVPYEYIINTNDKSFNKRHMEII